MALVSPTLTPALRRRGARVLQALGAFGVAVAVAGCATRAADVKPLPTDPANFRGWSCEQLDDEIDGVRQRAAELAYAVDTRAGNNLIALGVGATLFWPALLAMRTDGPEAQQLALLKGRDAALRAALQAQQCPPAAATLSATRAAQWPVAVGERLVYEERRSTKEPVRELTQWLTELRRSETALQSDASGLPWQPEGVWRVDRAGNLLEAPDGALQWPRLLRLDKELGAVSAGELAPTGDLTVRARVRAQVVAVGPQRVAGRRFDVAVLELFGDVNRGDVVTRLDGALVVDRETGLLLRLDLRSADPQFNLQRRLLRIEAAPR